MTARWGPLLLALAAVGSSTAGQQAIHTEAAVQPSAGTWFIRQQFAALSFGRDPTGLDHRVSQYTATTFIAYGVTQDLALTLSVPVSWRDVDGPAIAGSHGSGGGEHGGDGHGFGLGGGGGGGGVLRSHEDSPLDHSGHSLGWNSGLDDLTIGARLRIWKKDLGPIDTARLSLIAAVEAPTGDDAFSSDSWDPIIGAAFTTVRGRHGFNADVRWKFNTGEDEQPVLPGMGEADAGYYNAAWLYRLAPARYGASTTAAWYALVEANGIYETNGDHELLIAPGLMYEARNWAIEASIQLPVWQDIEHRPQTEFTVLLGIRLLL